MKNPPAGILWFVSGENFKQVLQLLQALDKLSIKPSLYFITHGIQPISPITSLSETFFNGFYKTVKLEMPDLDCRHIDLSPGEKLPVKELSALDQEEQVAYVNGIRYVPRLIKETLIKTKPFKINPEGSYLITGGLGGLGLKVSEWLVKHGAKHLVLAGRNISKTVEIPNATIEKIAVDISKKESVESLMKKFGNEWPELKGIVHAAGVLDDAPLLSQDWEKFEKVFAPKVAGSWNLHEASQGKPLDFFILFSSIASVLGSRGQSNYAAANSYLEALATLRSEKGLPALAISWGPWAEVGMAAKLTERHSSAGFIPFKPEEGLKILEQALNQSLSHLLAANVDWKLVPYSGALLGNLIQKRLIAAPILFHRLTEAFPAERKEILIDYLQKTVGKILGSFF